MIAIGSQVTLRETSPFAGSGDNPAAGTSGIVAAIDGNWLVVLWQGRDDTLNYRYTDLQIVAP